METIMGVVGLGLILGVGARRIDAVAPRWVGNVGAVWFLVAFVSGRFSRGVRMGAALGAAALIAAWVAYYSMRIFADQTVSMRYLARVGLFWLVASLLVGALGGIAGARSHSVPVVWGVPVGVFLGEAAAVGVLSQRWEQVWAELLGAFVILLWMPRQIPHFFKAMTSIALVVGIVAAVAIGYRTILN
jgi:hypothetical protein